MLGDLRIAAVLIAPRDHPASTGTRRKAKQSATVRRLVERRSRKLTRKHDQRRRLKTYPRVRLISGAGLRGSGARLDVRECISTEREVRHDHRTRAAPVDRKAIRVQRDEISAWSAAWTIDAICILVPRGVVRGTQIVVRVVTGHSAIARRDTNAEADHGIRSRTGAGLQVITKQHHLRLKSDAGDRLISRAARAGECAGLRK